MSRFVKMWSGRGACCYISAGMSRQTKCLWHKSGRGHSARLDHITCPCLHNRTKNDMLIFHSQLLFPTIPLPKAFASQVSNWLCTFPFVPPKVTQPWGLPSLINPQRMTIIPAGVASVAGWGASLGRQADRCLSMVICTGRYFANRDAP